MGSPLTSDLHALVPKTAGATPDLRVHLDGGNDPIRRYVLSLIRTSYPEWMDSDGDYPECLDTSSRS